MLCLVKKCYQTIVIACKISNVLWFCPMTGISGVTERAKAKRVGPYSTANALRQVDQRTREGSLIRKTRADLIAHVGGKPSATQLVLIERAAALTLQLALLDSRNAHGGMTDHDVRTYLAWTNTLTRLMRQLGLKSAAQQPPSLKDHLAQRGSTAA